MKLQQGEQLVRQQANVVWVRGRFNNAVGKLVLTNQRLAFEQRSVLRSSVLGQFGAVGDLADAALPRNIVVNLSLGQLASFSRTRVVSSRKVLPITTRTGEEFLFSGPKFEQWAPVLMQAGLIEVAPASAPAPSAPSMNPFGQQPYGQQPYSQQQPYPAGYAPPQGQAPALLQAPAKKGGIPWWGWLLIASAIVLVICGVLSIAVLALSSASSGIVPGSLAATHHAIVHAVLHATAPVTL